MIEPLHQAPQDPVKGNNPVLTRQILRWVVCTHRLLSLSELLDALAVDLNESGFDEDARIDKQTIMDITAGLIIADANEMIRLMHHTANEYFDKIRDQWFLDADAEIAGVPLHYLGIEANSKPCNDRNRSKEEAQFMPRKQKHPFLHYAYLYWGTHARESGVDNLT